MSIFSIRTIGIGTIGRSFKSDMAIDNVRLFDTPCSGKEIRFEIETKTKLYLKYGSRYIRIGTHYLRWHTKKITFKP